LIFVIFGGIISSFCGEDIVQFLKTWDDKKLITISQALYVFSRIARCRVRHKNFIEFLANEKIKFFYENGRRYVLHADIVKAAELWKPGGIL